MSHSIRPYDRLGKGATRDSNALMEPGLRAFFQIAEAWSLTEAEQSAILGKLVPSAMPASERLPAGDIATPILERVSYVLGIYCALHTIFPDQQQADGWVRRPNAASLFSGKPALALICSGRIEDLRAVRDYLEAQGLADPHE